MRIAATSPDGVCLPRGYPGCPRRLAGPGAGRILKASATDLWPSAVSANAIVKSDGPMYSPSRPGVTAIASTFASPSAVSIIANTSMASLISAGSGPTAEREGHQGRDHDLIPVLPTSGTVTGPAASR